MPHKFSSIQFIEQEAFKILTGTKLAKAPIDVKSVASKIGLQVHPQVLPDDISGALVIEKGIGKVTYNTTHTKNRKRFTIAHEIGHYVLKHNREGQFFIDKTKFYRNSDSSTGELKQEREANAFAAALLMPEFLIIKEASKLKIDLADSYGIDLEHDSISQLATKFEVSPQAMTYRIANLYFL